MWVCLCQSPTSCRCRFHPKLVLAVSSSLVIAGLKAGLGDQLTNQLKPAWQNKDTCFTSLASLGDKLKPTIYIFNQLKTGSTGLRLFHTEHEKMKRISNVMTLWNKTTASYGCFHIDRKHSRTENVNVCFFVQSDRYFQFRKVKTQPVQ